MARVIWKAITQFQRACCVGMLLCPLAIVVQAVQAQISGVSISRVDGQIAPGVVRAGDTIVFHMQYTNPRDWRYMGVSTGFKIYSRASLSSGTVGSGTATWITTPPDHRPFNWNFTNFGTSTGPQVDTNGVFRKRDFSAFFRFICSGCDGRGSDTVYFGCAIGDWSQQGLPARSSTDGFSLWVVTRPEDTGKVICIDSVESFEPGGAHWRWHPSCPNPNNLHCTESVHPEWGGPYCFLLVPYSCCFKRTGNIDCSANGVVDITDVTFLIDHLYLSHQPLCCSEQANCDGVDGVDIGDLSALIDRLYISFASLAPCPQ